MELLQLDISSHKSSKSSMPDQFDDIEGYCRMLGHYVPFTYCRTLQSQNPCSKILNCYFERLPIQEYVDRLYSKEEQEKLFAPQTPKFQSILDLIKQAKDRSAHPDSKSS